MSATHARLCARLSRLTALFILSFTGCLYFSLEAGAVNIDTVPVGDVGNPTDPITGNVFGSVAYNYRLGTYEVTNSQYAAFLNAKARADNSLGLYSAIMGSDVRGGITQGASGGFFNYAVKPDMGNKPVNFVKWYDAIRFANWLANGQGAGSTETGSYTLGPLKANGTPINQEITRNAGATWVIPSEDEWYKAAYYQASARGGDSDSYWQYPTATNVSPAVASAIDTFGPTRGDIGNPGANVANWLAGADWNGKDGNVTTVGSAGPLSASFYGTFDQAGNVNEWTEQKSDTAGGGSFRNIRGGSWALDNIGLYSADRTFFSAENGADNVGFRVAVVPEPSTLALSALGLIALAAYRWRRKR